MRSGIIILSLALVVFFQPPVAAQTVPPGDQPGADVSRLESGVKEKKKELEEKKPAAPEIEIEKKEAEPASKGPAFLLKEIKITGATIFKTEDLVPLYKDHLNKTVTFDDLNTIAEKITAKYSKAGYLTTEAYIPAQKIESGVVEIRVAEGRMGSLEIEGNKWFSTPLIKKYFHVKKNEILNIKKLQKDILRLNQNTDLEVKAAVFAGAKPGTSDITLKVTDKFPYHAGISVDNQGTRLTGKYRPAASFRSTNLTGRNDSLFVNTLFSSGSFGESVMYLLPVGTYGTKAGFDFTYFTMKLGRELKSYKITGETFIYTPHVSREIYLSEDIELSADAGLEIKSIKKKMDNSTTTDDQLRLPYLGMSFTENDRFFSGGQTVFAPKVTFGTAWFLGAYEKGYSKMARAGTGGSFFKYEQSVSRIQRMPFDSYIQARSLFQFSSETLPPSEELQIGGVNSIRGYPEGDYLADSGATLSVDWVFPNYLIPKQYKLPFSNILLRNVVQPVVFTDLGGGFLKKTMPGEVKEKFLMGIGGGLRINCWDKVFVRLGWAAPIGDDPVSGAGSSTFFFTVQSEI